MKLRILFLLSVVLAFSYGCDEEDLTQLDPNRVVPESFFETEGQLDAAVISGYATLRAQHLTLRHYYIMHDLMDDQHMATSAMQIAPELTQGQQTSSSRHVRELFDAHYDMIHRMNTALDGILQNTTVAAAKRLEFEAEARFLRGWAYAEIAYLWGGAPIYTTRALSTADYQPRATREAVYQQAQSDLRFAVENLAVDRTPGRANKGAARGFLARSLMQSGNIAEAKEVLQDIVDMDKYFLLDNFGDNFIEANDFLGEALFEVIFAGNGGYNWDDAGDTSWGGGNSRSARAQEYGPFWRNAVPSTALMDDFAHEALGDSYTDPRFGETVIFDGDTYNNGMNVITINQNSPPIVFNGEERFANFYKYGVYYDREVPSFILTTSNLILMRYADVLLLLAEAEARTNGDLDKARDLINQVRERAGVPSLDEAGIANATADDIVQAVVAERAVELVSEQVRSRDLRRWHDAGIVDAEAILGYSADRFLLPIPLDEIINNPMVTNADQNPGYN